MYNIVIDLDSPKELLLKARDQSEITSLRNLKALLAGNQIFGEDGLDLDYWSTTVLKHHNIFVKSNTKQAQPHLALNFKKRSNIVEEIRNTLSKVQNTRIGVPDYRYTRIELIAFDKMHDTNYEKTDYLRASFLGYGVIRLFREEINEKTTEDAELGPEPTSRSKIAAILAVPTYMSISAILKLVGENFVKDVVHFRIFKTQQYKRYMCILKFQSEDQCAAFQRALNGKPFNSIERERCQVVQVNKIIINSPHDKANKSEELNFTYGIIELPTCPVCLERMDTNMTGLLTIPCQHTFHCQCLAKWRDDTCPVCRYSQKERTSKDVTSEASQCSVCGDTANLWICLICGNVGCDRYNSAHAVNHFKETSHCFAMQIETQRIWDYAGDQYVHRLIQNQTDGKLVELSLNNEKAGSSSDSNGKNYSADKVDTMELEYSKLMIAQLEEYEKNMTKIMEEEKIRFANLQTAMGRLGTDSKVSERTKELETKLDQMMQKYDEEKTLALVLTEKLEFFDKQTSQLKKENEDLKEEINDLLMHFQTMEKYKDADESVKEGKLVLKPSRKSSRKGSRK
ncbi:hypothetical protein PP7435_CHR3-1179 [Komagataella phaffii CBS 7435]|uniref:Uncharacterized protein n=2 Tax=Komagataella phaffii TaxID=460519 RepID=C4R3F7_KOMPG|nr:uncharacterized protein PAS_chr3_0063 [Komagataella phaffii GS115]AOA64288.1 GQ67_03073T0 [Komagataella phaffii]CAH2450290.1 hypothetical protein BQ9382_C3-6215 [Komagataella phaffii CBS 7435]AOA69166.1 GQ68_03057T0 [Komagataella phaffii GS115]CAY69992.1 Putative protein of unknown function, contains a zinc finger region and has homology to human BRAP2 [Komagataella phaffii GS115]CCA40121.1 hypothetical protein PP7435_CHR3-1179 [Komagataella phaffii CBS 7435]